MDILFLILGRNRGTLLTKDTNWEMRKKDRVGRNRW
jgi:hypothetical protein